MHDRSPLAELPLVSPPQAPDEVYSEAEAVVAGFARIKGGPPALAKALEGKTLPADAVKLALRAARSAGPEDPALVAALRKAGLKHSIATFPNVDHAFFNPTSARHDPAAAAAAYKRMLSWFGTHLAT